MLQNYIPVALMLVIVAGFGVMMVNLSRWIGPQRPDFVRGYTCAVGLARSSFRLCAMRWRIVPASDFFRVGGGKFLGISLSGGATVYSQPSMKRSGMLGTMSKRNFLALKGRSQPGETPPLTGLEIQIRFESPGLRFAPPWAANTAPLRGSIRAVPAFRERFIGQRGELLL